MGRKKSLLGDRRLVNGFHTLLERMVDRQSVILRQIGANRNEEVQFGRFVNHPKVKPDMLIKQYWDTTTQDWSSKHILVVSDSSTLSYDRNTHREELGFVSRHDTQDGFDIHPSILLDASNGSCLGLGALDFIYTAKLKNEQDRRQRDKQYANRRNTAFEDKQSYKWLSSPTKAIANAPSAAQYTLVGDREADIYELMHRTIAKGWHFLYRCKTNRSIESSGDEQVKIKDALALCPIAHTYEVKVKATKKRRAHLATLDVKYTKVEILQTESNSTKDTPAKLPVYVVEVKEQPASVASNEPPVHWILLTSHPIERVEQALEVIQWYCWRWTIEQVFRTLKLRGLDITHAQVRTYHALTNLTTMALIAALKVMLLVSCRQSQKQQSAQPYFTAQELDCMQKINTKVQGNTEKLSNPYKTGTIAYASWVIARLGGWSGYSSQRPPGPITMILGLNRFYQIFEGFTLGL